MLPGLPKLPRVNLPAPKDLINPLKEVVKEGRQQIERAGDDIRSLASEMHTTTEAPQETKTPTQATGTACLSCCRDHFSTTSSALSEALRFAHPDSIKSPEVTRRLRIALDELNILERIDLAPDAIGMLSEPERKLAIWALNSSRDLRHVIGEVRSVEGLEEAARNASKVTEEFMKKFWDLEEECPECFSLATLRDYIDKRRRQRETEV